MPDQKSHWMKWVTDILSETLIISETDKWDPESTIVSINVLPK